MKNLFIINSHTTFLTAMGTIDYLQLPAESIVMLYMRNYKNDLIVHPYEVIEVTDFFNSIPNRNLYKSIFSRKKELRKIDAFIEQKIVDRYRLFCPHLGLGIWQAIYTHPLCTEMSYIQEGGIAYSEAYIVHPNFKKRLYLFLVNKIYRYDHRVWAGRWYTCGTMNKQKELHSFAINSVFFKHLPSVNHIIKWPKVKTDVEIKIPSSIFVFDGYIRNGMIEPDLYMATCNKLVKSFALNCNYVKFHPAQTKDERDVILSFFASQNIQCEVLPDNIPFEMILASNKNLRVIGFSSSLLCFAYDLGHEVIGKYDDWLLPFSSKLMETKKKYGSVSIELYKQESTKP